MAQLHHRRYLLPEADLLRGADKAAKGDQFTELASDAPVSIWQNLATIPGKTYRITFSYSGRPGLPAADNTFGFSWDGVSQGWRQDPYAVNRTVNVWQTMTFDATATKTSTELRFTDLSTPNIYGMYLDEVHVVPVD